MRTAYRMAMMLLAVGLVLLPAVVGAQASAPKGELVYEDNFSSAAKSGLEDDVNATDYQRGFHPPGVYHLRVTNPDEVRWSLLPNQSYGQFSVQIEMWDNSDTFQGGVAQGLIFRAEDESHFYTLLLDPRNGQYSVRKLDGDEWSDLVPAADSPLVKGRSDVNLVRVDGEGDDFTIYLNDEMLTSFSDASYASGSLGMLISNVDAVEPHMHFDNLAIYSTEAGPAAATTTSAPGTLPSSGAPAGVPAGALALFALLLLGAGATLRRAGR